MAEEVPDLSIVIPAYNEEERLPETFKRIASYLEKSPVSSEIVLVDDGSTDQTVKLAEKLARELSLRLVVLKNPRNQGKGAALKKGMLAASGRAVLFTDADLSIPIEELQKFLPCLGDFQVVIGSRKIKGAQILVRQPLYREFMGKVYSWLARVLVAPAISDFTCGFKLFTRDVAQRLFSCQRISNWSFDAEILFLAKKFGYKIKEVPVVWVHSPETKVRLWRDVFGSFWGLLKIIWNNFLGRYK